MYRNETIGQNTLHVNDMLVRIFKIILLALAVGVILKASGIITLPWLHLAIMVSIGIAVCVLPIVCRHFRMDGSGLRYVNIYCAAVLCTLGYCYLNAEVIMLAVIPVGFACLYFDVKLIRHSAVLSALGLILGEVLSSVANWGFVGVAQGGYIRTVINVLQFGTAAFLLIAISGRAMNELSNIHNFYENIDDILSNASFSSKSLKAAEGMLLQAVCSLSGSNVKKDEPLSDIKVNAIISNINKSMENVKEIMKYTQAIPKGKRKGLKAEAEAVRIEEYTRNSNELILKLANYTDKIKEDINLISVILNESKLLSMKAAAEAENASSGGKGSPILAAKVDKLADESVESAIHIQELLNSVVNDAENTVSSVAQIYGEISKSLELINRTVETLLKWLMYKNME